MKQDGRDLIAHFRELAPDRRPIAIQRWSPRRILLSAALVGIVVFFVTQLAHVLAPAHDLPVTGKPDCGTGNLMILSAQSVPSAALLPCLATLPAGWKLDGMHVQRTRTTFFLNSDIAGHHAVQVRLMRRADCNVSGAQAVPSDELGTRRYERPDRLSPLRSTRFYLFPGGCVTYRFAFNQGASPSEVFDVDQALAFQTRASLVNAVNDRTDLKLCGRGSAVPGRRPIVTQTAAALRRKYLLMGVAGLALLIACGVVAHDGKIHRRSGGSSTPSTIYRLGCTDRCGSSNNSATSRSRCCSAS